MIRTRMLELQWRQLNHDERYHREITRLSVGDRMKHMALHLAKYAGTIAESEDGPARRKALIDAYIISLAGANTVGLDIGRTLSPDASSTTSLRELGAQLSSDEGFGKNDDAFLRKFVSAVGKLAKACESLDHVEAFPFKERMQCDLLEVFKVIVAEAARQDFDLEADAETRLEGVRARHLFNEYLKDDMAQVTNYKGSAA